MKSDAKTPEEYLATLPPDRAEAIGAVREVVLKNLPEGFVEGVYWGMLCYHVPLDVLKAKNGDPLAYIALASQKRHMSLHLWTSTKDGEWFRREYEATGKKLDMGVGCVRFSKLENLPLDLIAKAVRKVPMEEFMKSRVEMGVARAPKGQDV